MTRSVRKGPFVDWKLMKKIAGKSPGDTPPIKTWARRSQIAPEMIGFTFSVHNGKTHTDIVVSEEMVGHRFGEFVATKRFPGHGGRLQKATEEEQKQAEIAAARSAKETTM
ncbi:MAG: 30S ribosomal protein S19 [Candidatus Kaiserbacteria bacterium]|nr:30S ribosomal protein S19 [Candidatus Kaiserbacteria bacterium]